MTASHDRYSHGHHESVLRSHRWRTAENSAGYLLPHLKPADELLDLGSGPGTITVDLALHLPLGSVTGLDNAPDAVRAAQQLLGESGAGRVSFELGDIYALAFPDDTFDVVHAHQVLQHLSDPVAALREMRRVCRSGGLVAARDADYAGMIWHPASEGLTRWLALYQRVARRNGGEPDAGRRLKSWALAAGFTEVQASASVWCFTTTEDVGWWADTWAERVTKSSFSGQAQEHGYATAAELAGLARAWRSWAATPDAWFTIPHGEVLCRP